MKQRATTAAGKAFFASGLESLNSLIKHVQQKRCIPSLADIPKMRRKYPVHVVYFDSVCVCLFFSTLQVRGACRVERRLDHRFVVRCTLQCGMLNAKSYRCVVVNRSVEVVTEPLFSVIWASKEAWPVLMPIQPWPGDTSVTLKVFNNTTQRFHGLVRGVPGAWVRMSSNGRQRLS